MADLPKEFFKRDLTAQEWVDLERQISDSPKDSLRFAKFARKFYLGLGLPNPGPYGPSAGPGMTFLKLTGLFAAATVATYLAWKGLRPDHPAALPPAPVPVQSPAVPTKPAAIQVTAPKAQVRHTVPAAQHPQPTTVPQPKAPVAALPAAAAKPPPEPTATPNDSPSGLFQNGFKGQDINR